jgi:molecular chaperone DnaK (HSP70)
MFIIFAAIVIRPVGSVLVAIDLGCESMRTSMIERGQPVEIVPNGEGRRFTSAVAAILANSNDEVPAIFTSDDVSLFTRSVGDLGVANRHPLNSTRFLPLLLGKNHSRRLVSYFMKRGLVMPFDADNDKYLELIAPPEFFSAQLMMTAIQDVKRTKINRTVDQIVLVIPKFLTHHQRSAFLRAAKLATYKAFLVDTMAAVGTLFAIERGQLFRKKELIVCFIDIGASQIQVSIQEFKYQKSSPMVTELGYAWNDTFGSYDIDRLLARVIRREVLKEKPDAKFNERSIQRTITAARKVKHELTIQPEVSLFLEDIVHGFDFTFTYSIDRLKKLCSRQSKILNETFQEALLRAQLSEAADIDRFELVGGGTRSPLFIQAVTNIFGDQVPVQRSLNTEEAAVVGAGYYMASQKGDWLAKNVIWVGASCYRIVKDDVGKTTNFYYDEGQKLPLGIKPFIRSVEMGLRGKAEIVEGRVRVHGCRKLSRSGLYKEKRFGVERMLSAFESQEREAAEKLKLLHEFETFLMDTREQIASDPVVTEVASEEERIRALKMIAHMQYLIQLRGVPDNETMQRMKLEVEQETGGLIKRAEDRKNAPELYKRIESLLEKVRHAVEVEWPAMGMSPKAKLLSHLGRVCSRTEKWLDEHTDLEDLTKEDLDLVYERLRKAFDVTKTKLHKSKVKDL